MKLVLPCAVVIAIAIVAPAEAQLCAGAPSFRMSPFQAGVDSVFSGDAQGVGASFAAGRTLFGAVTVTATRFSDRESASRSVGGAAGLEVPLGGDRRGFVCPVAHVAWGVGPNVGPLEVSTVSAGAGGRLGVVAAEAGRLMVVPTLGLSAVYRRSSAEFRGLEEEESDAYGLAAMGIGLLFNERIGITPGILIPFSVTDPDVAFLLTVAFGF